MNVTITADKEKTLFSSTTRIPVLRFGEIGRPISEYRVVFESAARALLASAYFAYTSTSLYRIRGNDTLTIGKSDEWIERKGAINIINAHYPSLDLEDLLLREVKMINPLEIMKFLSENMDLQPVLLEANRMVKKIFGENAELILELRTDPEIEDDKILHANIKATGDIDEQLDKLDAFDKNWLIQRLDLVNRRVIFDLDFS